jgi:hypothetical protein
MTSIDTQAPAIEAWETEDGNVVVWGTHDPQLAEVASTAYWELNRYDEEDRPTVEEWESSGNPQWAYPSLKDEEVWAKDLYGDTEQPGWIPYLVFWV